MSTPQSITKVKTQSKPKARGIEKGNKWLDVLVDIRAEIDHLRQLAAIVERQSSARHISQSWPDRWRHPLKRRYSNGEFQQVPIAVSS